MSKPILAIYPRVSSRTQDAASQLPDLERWVAANLDVLRGDVEVKWYRETFTGKTMDRPSWNKLQADIRTGKVKTVVIWRLDRLGRTASGLTTLFDELLRLGVNLVSLKDGLDLSTPAGRLMANVLASVAQFETEIRGERVSAGQAVAREKGVKFGRKAVGEGNGKKIKVTPEQEAQIRKLNSEGVKKAAIARAVGLSRQSIYNILGQDA